MNIVHVQQFIQLLKEETAARCGHEERKGQLSMSWLHLDEADILHRYRQGHMMEEETKSKLYKGTQCEVDLRMRIESVFKSTASLEMGHWGPPREIRAYDGRLKGHTDGHIGTTVLEIKTIPDIYVMRKMQEHKLPRKVICQSNSYMFWGRYENALVLYETRVEGEFWPVLLNPDPILQQELKRKAERILALVG